MVVFVALLKRREGMSPAAFKDYYETVHSRLLGKADASHASGATGYRRRYLEPAPHPIAQPTHGVDYDVIMELTYPDRAALDHDMAFLSRPDIRALFAEDEDRLFDRRYSHCYVVSDEVASR